MLIDPILMARLALTVCAMLALGVVTIFIAAVFVAVADYAFRKLLKRFDYWKRMG